MALADHLDKLRAFKTIANCGTIREAAEKLHITQPSLTRLIQTLERESGVELFVRGRSGVQVTNAGQMLLSYAESILVELDDLEERLKNPLDDLSGHLRIGTYESLAEYLWPEFIASLRRTTPQLKVSLRTNRLGSHLRDLEVGEIDMLVDAEPRTRGDFLSWVLYEDRFQFYLGEKHVQAFAPEAAEGLTLIHCPAAFDRDNKSIVQHLEENGFFFKEKIELDSFTSARAFCLAGVGIAALPQRLAERDLRSKSLFEVSLKGFSAKGFGPHSIVATVRSDRKDDRRLIFLRKILKDRFKA